MLKRGVANGEFSSSSAKLAADINGDGNVDVLDVTELEKFLSNK
jgi:hypothetical protein